MSSVTSPECTEIASVLLLPFQLKLSQKSSLVWICKELPGFFRCTRRKLSLQFSWVVAMSAWAQSHPAASVKLSSTTWHNLTQLTQPGVTNQWTPWFTNYSNYFRIHILPLCSNPSQLSLFSAPYESGWRKEKSSGGRYGRKEGGRRENILPGKNNNKK